MTKYTHFKDVLGRLRKPLQIAVVLLASGFVFQVLYRNIGQVRDAISGGEISFRPTYLAASYLCLAVFLISRALLWHYITVRVNAAIAPGQAILAWLISLLGKNIPGRVFLVAGRAYLYGRHGVGAGRVILGFMLEVSCSLAAAMLILLSCLMTRDVAAGVPADRLRWLLVAGIALILVASHPRVLRLLLNLALRLLKRPPTALPLRYRDILSFISLSCVNWLLLGLGFFLMARSVIDVDWRLLPFLTGAFAFALVVGLITVVAPAGLGVREGVLLAALNSVMPAGIAAVVAIVSRLWITIGETAAAGLALMVNKLTSGERNAPNQSIGKDGSQGSEEGT